MSYPNNRHGRHDAASLYSSDRSGYSSDRSPYTQYTGAYTERGEALDYSDRTPYSQGEYTQGGYTTGGYTQGGYTQGGYATSNYSDRSRGALDSSDSRRSSAYGGYGGSIDNSGYPSQSRGSNPYETSDMSQSSARRKDDLNSVGQSSRSYQPYNSAQYNRDNASVGGTTVAEGGRGRCPYQIEFQVQNQGKQISASKRIIHFRFGFANASALSQGKTGTDCRGDEHDIVVTWSITGGKRAISMDGREVQYSAGKRANASRRADILETSWRLSDHVYELSCYAYKPSAGSPEKRNPRWARKLLTKLYSSLSDMCVHSFQVETVLFGH